MEMEASRFYSRAASLTSDVHMRELLNMLADEERKHQRAAGRTKTSTSRKRQNPWKRNRITGCLCCNSCSRAGRADGWFRIHAGAAFAAAFATHKSWTPFLSEWRQASAPAYPWASPSRFLTMARLPGAGPLGFAAR